MSIVLDTPRCDVRARWHRKQVRLLDRRSVPPSRRSGISTKQSPAGILRQLVDVRYRRIGTFGSGYICSALDAVPDGLQGTDCVVPL